MEALALLALLRMFTFAVMTIESVLNNRDTNQISRDKMKESILDIEKILNFSNTHYEIELDHMSDQDLTNLYKDLGENSIIISLKETLNTTRKLWRNSNENQSLFRFICYN